MNNSKTWKDDSQDNQRYILLWVLAYILGKQDGKARILYAEGARANAQASDIANDFALQASMRPHVKKPVCHTILSFSAEDTERLSDKIMTDLAKEYLQRMGYADTQYLIVVMS